MSPGAAEGPRKALDKLERLTRERVVDDPQEVRWRWWQRIRLSLPGKRKAPAPEAAGEAARAARQLPQAPRRGRR